MKRSPATQVYLPTGHRLGRYEVLIKLATGGMAVVYVGRAQGLAGFERLVALKVLHQNLAHEDEFVRMFLDEARLAARIRHPNVVPTIDISDSPNAGYFIVMDYVEGDHFGALLGAAHKAGMRLPPAVSLRIVVDALAGLGAAHDLVDERGDHLKLVHRDVSPHNIMVGSDGVARLTDFGVAKAENRLAHTRDGQLKGKLAYMAPEQAVRGDCDSRSDLFAMGVIAWEALTGRRLFRADNPGATLHRLLNEPIVAPSSIDPALAPLDATLMKALARDPRQRYQTAEQMLEAFESSSAALGGLASLRDVSAVVRKLTAEKLRKERELLELAKDALKLETGAVIGSDEGTNITGSDVSMASLSLSRSKVSGVFSSATATGMQLPPPAPAPTASADAELVADMSRLSSRFDVNAAKPYALGLALLVALAGAFVLLSPTDDAGIESIELTSVTRVQPAAQAIADQQEPEPVANGAESIAERSAEPDVQPDVQPNVQRRDVQPAAPSSDVLPSVLERSGVSAPRDERRAAKPSVERSTAAPRSSGESSTSARPVVSREPRVDSARPERNAPPRQRAEEVMANPYH